MRMVRSHARTTPLVGWRTGTLQPAKRADLVRVRRIRRAVGHLVVIENARNNSVPMLIARGET